MIRKDPFPDIPETGLSRETLADIVLLARAYDAQIPPTDPDSGSNASDDGAVGALEQDDTTERALRAAIVSLDEDARAALVALTWIGRGDFEGADWQSALTAARERKEGATSRYLMGIPLLGDYLEEGAEALQINLTADETAALHAPGGEAPAEDDRT